MESKPLPGCITGTTTNRSFAKDLECRIKTLKRELGILTRSLRRARHNEALVHPGDVVLLRGAEWQVIRVEFWPSNGKMRPLVAKRRFKSGRWSKVQQIHGKWTIQERRSGESNHG
jgi:hypothetical protein